MHLLIILVRIGEMASMLYFKTEFEILLRPIPLSFRSFITFFISSLLVGKKTNELGFRFLRNCNGSILELGNWSVRFVAMLVK